MKWRWLSRFARASEKLGQWAGMALRQMLVYLDSSMQQSASPPMWKKSLAPSHERYDRCFCEFETSLSLIFAMQVSDSSRQRAQDDFPSIEQESSHPGKRLSKCKVSVSLTRHTTQAVFSAFEIQSGWSLETAAGHR